MLKGVKYKGIYWHGVDSIKDVEEVSRDLTKRAEIQDEAK